MIGDNIVFLEETGSTNQYLLEWISKEKVTEGTLVVARNQTAGRGLERNTWESSPGLNLTFSFVLYPNFLAPSSQFYLNKVISLALADLAGNVLQNPGGISIKWPNDLYYQDLKMAGTLIQNGVKGDRLDHSVIGIGLNVNQVSFGKGIPNPVSFKMISGKTYNLDAMMHDVLECLRTRYRELVVNNLRDIDDEYLQKLYKYGQLSGYLYKGEPVTGMITGIGRYGHLLLEIPGQNILECDIKELEFKIPHSPSLKLQN